MYICDGEIKELVNDLPGEIHDPCFNCFDDCVDCPWFAYRAEPGTEVDHGSEIHS